MEQKLANFSIKEELADGTVRKLCSADLDLSAYATPDLSSDKVEIILLVRARRHRARRPRSVGSMLMPRPWHTGRSSGALNRPTGLSGRQGDPSLVAPVSLAQECARC